MTTFTNWLKDLDAKEDLQKVMVSPEDKLDQLYWHKILECKDLGFPDGLYFVTACLKEDDGYVFGLFPLEVDGEYSWITYRSENLDWLINTKIIETNEYDHVVSEIDLACDELTKNLQNKGA